jgi:hypothetical protein
MNRGSGSHEIGRQDEVRSKNLPSSLTALIFLVISQFIRKPWKAGAVTLVIIVLIGGLMWTMSRPQQIGSSLRLNPTEPSPPGGRSGSTPEPEPNSLRESRQPASGHKPDQELSEVTIVSIPTDRPAFIPPEVVDILNGGFAIGKYEVTNQQYRCFVNDENYRAPTYWKDPKFNDGRQPVVGVRWDDAKAYCDWLTKKMRAKNDLIVHYDLPTKEQWDAAAGYKKDHGSSFPWEASLDKQKERANVGGARTLPLQVDRSLAHTTEYGIVDMPGNVAEWCRDSSVDGTRRIVRGGYWASKYSDVSYTSRLEYPPDETKVFVGFRIVKLKDE